MNLKHKLNLIFSYNYEIKKLKKIWTPFTLALSNYMFEIDDERRGSKLFIGSIMGKKIPNKIIGKYTLLKILEF